MRSRCELEIVKCTNKIGGSGEFNFILDFVDI